jgi:hypothetical protein
MSYRFSRRPHPHSADHDVVEWNTKVHHQLCITKDIERDDIMKEILKYLRGYDEETPEGKIHHKGYEDDYPMTAITPSE